MDENTVIYPETETTLFRVRDIKQVLEDYTHLSVLDLTLISESAYTEILP